MKYNAHGMVMWDPWFIEKDGEIHTFHLQRLMADSPRTPQEANSMGHAVSRDGGLHWEECPTILPPLGEAYPMDCLQKYTGCVVEKDGLYYLFYTMRNAVNQQRIGLATSTDLYDWKVYEGNPVLSPDENLLIGYDKCDELWGGIVDCRDMMIIEEDGVYYGYFAASAVIDGKPQGVAACARSTDLYHWEDQRIVWTSRFGTCAEVPDVYQLGGKWYMTRLAGECSGGRGIYSDENVTLGALYAKADSPAGPFVEGEDNTFVGGFASNFGYTNRHICYQGRELMFHVEKQFKTDVLALPKVVRLTEDGRLRAFFNEDLYKLNTETLVSPEKPAGFVDLPPSAFAWPLVMGEWKQENGLYVGSCPSWQTGMLGVEAHNVHIEAKLDLSACRAAGFALYSSDNNGALRRYVVLAEPEKNRVMVTEPYDFPRHAVREYAFRKPSCHLRVMFIDDGLEAYVGDEFLISLKLENLGHNHIGLFVDRGEVQIEALSVYRVEE